MATLFAAGFVLNAVGVAASMTGWIRYRHPGQAFWVAAPVWQASRYLRPPGVRLWVGGCAVGMVGVAFTLLGVARVFAG